MMFSMLSALSALSAVFCFAVSAAELNEKFFDVPAKEIELKNVPVIDLDAPPSFPITLQPYQPPKMPAPLKTVTFEHPVSNGTHSMPDYQFLPDTQTPRCVKIVHHVFDPQSRKKGGFYAGYAGNLLTGQAEKIFTCPFGNPPGTTVNSPANSPPFYFSPDGTYFSPDGTKMIINNQYGPVSSCIVQCENLKPVKILYAFKNCRFEWWLNDQIALVNVYHDVDRGLAAFRLSDGKILWRMKPDVDMLAICPAGRRYIVVRKNLSYSPRPVSNTLFLVDAEQGRAAGSFENTEEVQHTFPSECFKEFAFSPSGTRLASGRFDGNIRIWDVTTGKKLTEFYTKDNLNPMWVDEEFLYCRPLLIHIEKQIPVWEYPQDIHQLGDTFFIAESRMAENNYNQTSTAVRPCPLLPHDKNAIQKILDLPPEKQFILRPGMKAALKIDPRITACKNEFEAYMTKMLKENGVEVAKTAPVTVSVFVDMDYQTTTYNKETGKKINGADKDSPPAYSETRVRTFYINISVMQDKIGVWKSANGYHCFNPIESSPFILPQNDAILDFDDSPATYAEDMTNKILAYTVKGKQPYKELLYRDKLPKQIPNPAIRGRSVLAPDGTIETDTQPYLPEKE